MLQGHSGIFKRVCQLSDLPGAGLDGDRSPQIAVAEIGGDICQTDILEAAMDSVDGVFHLAALWLLQCHDFPRSAFDVNIRGTFNVLEACVKRKIKRLVYSSSASVYGDAVREPMDEDHPFNNRTMYGATKIAGEQFCRLFFAQPALDYVALRYMNRGHNFACDGSEPTCDTCSWRTVRTSCVTRPPNDSARVRSSIDGLYSPPRRLCA